MKKLLIVFTTLSLILLLPGCKSFTTSSSVPSSSSIMSSAPPSSSVSSKPVTFNVDWDKCLKDTRANITGKAYPYVKDMYVKIDEKEKLITFTATFADATKPTVALDYADTMLRQYNLFANLQDSQIALGNKDSYGGLYDEYQVMIGIAPQSQINNQSKWFIYDAIGKGVQTKHTIKLQKAYR